jgi:RNA polymerase sigma factor (sigma-70 family)
MTPAALSPPVTASVDPVKTALADDHVWAELRAHARAVLGNWMQDRPVTERADAAETALQETARRALDKRFGYDPAGAVAAWVHGILINVLRETARDLRRRPAQPPDGPEEWDRLVTAFAPDGGDEVKPDGDTAGILARLGPDQQMILRLRYIDALDHATIAARLGISIGNARVKLCRALAAARAVAGVAPGEDGR